MPARRFLKASLLLLILIVSSACGHRGSHENKLTSFEPSIFPDYKSVTIPPNIAPLNFIIRNPGKGFYVTASSSRTGYKIDVYNCTGIIKFPLRKWKRMIAESINDSVKVEISVSGRKKSVPVMYSAFSIYIAPDSIDPYLAYRLINPGYYSWSRIRIMQRSLQNFREKALFDNQIVEKNCANCHSFANRSNERMMLHVRGSKGGTYIFGNGKLTRTDPKVDGMPGSATYPAWHPGGRFIAFSSNQVRQSFYSQPGKSIEVFDLVSSLIVFDTEKNEISLINDDDTAKYMSTFPTWSPDGRYLYYCRSLQVINPDNPELEQIKNTRYNIVRREFFADSLSFGPPETILNASASGKSASFPRISPDGRSLVYTLADYGTFPIWHREADLYMLDLESMRSEIMKLNSSETESYHTWSSNGRWLVFSSKRIDGRSARPHFVYIDSDGETGKEFALPQKNPGKYDTMPESFNIPEFVNGKIELGPRDFARASSSEALKAKPAASAAGDKKEAIREIPFKANERAIH